MDSDGSIYRSQTVNYIEDFIEELKDCDFDYLFREIEGNIENIPENIENIPENIETGRLALNLPTTKIPRKRVTFTVSQLQILMRFYQQNPYFTKSKIQVFKCKEKTNLSERQIGNW